jgi:hypothetical protein
MARTRALADARSMETPREPAHPTHGSVSDPPPKDRPERPQHEMIRKDLPKHDIAEALDDFDGDEN